jgi:hypothetical protein
VLAELEAAHRGQGAARPRASTLTTEAP